MITEVDYPRFPGSEKLGKPDFTGLWTTDSGRAGEFNMHILNRRPSMRFDLRQLPTWLNLDLEFEQHEGVILDPLGVSVYSGILMPHVSIIFTKFYSQAAVEFSGAISQLIYRGRFNPRTSLYEGNYLSHNSHSMGSFTLRPL